LRQQAEHDHAETEIVGLGEGMQARERVGKAQQSHRAGQKEDETGRDCDHAQEIGGAHRSACSRSSFRGGEALLTKATEAKAASSASPRATSSAPRAPVAAATSSRAAMPPVPSSWAAMVRSTLAGPARMRTKPTATASRMKPAAASRNSVMARHIMARRAHQHVAEQHFLSGKIGGDRLVDVETMD